MKFSEPFVYPLKNLKKLVLGGFMIFPGVFLLLIPLIMVNGYFLRVAGSTIKGENELPDFSNWKNLFVKGLGVVLIYIIYSIFILILFIPAILCLVFGFLPITSYSYSGISYNYYNFVPVNMTLIVLGIIFALIALIPAIVLNIMSYIAIVEYSKNGYVEAAFKFGKIYKNFRMNTKNYIIGILLVFIVYVIAELIAFLLESIIIGSLLESIIIRIIFIGILYIFIGILYFYLSLFEIRLFAQIYKETQEKV